MALFAKLILKYVMDIPWRFRSRRDRNPSGGNALIGMLRISLRDRDVPIWLETPARDIVIEDGRVVGLEVEKDGQSFRIKAKRGVIFAAGGFEGNQVMRDKYLPNPTRREWTCGNAANTGMSSRWGSRPGRRWASWMTPGGGRPPWCPAKSRPACW